jgi:hypothetical protein
MICQKKSWQIEFTIFGKINYLMAKLVGQYEIK